MKAALELGQTSEAADTVPLREALLDEARLLAELLDVLRRQRAGVVGDDLQAVDDSVYAAHNVLRRLDEARRRRRTLMERLTGSENIGLEDLPAVLGDDVDAALLAARDGLVQGAHLLSREVAVNRRILRQALSNGEAHIRTLCGAPAAADAARTGGLLVNRKV